MGGKILQLLLIFFMQIWTTTAQNTDNDVLLALKNSWNNKPSSWDEGSDMCSGNWEGIKCTNSRVTSIMLSCNGLEGVLPDDIGQLTELQILDLSYNNELRGTLTAAIANLRNLLDLVLVGCNFNGPIPANIGNLQNLKTLSLNENGFTGSIPASIGNLTNLYWLDLTRNKLTGTIPVSSATMHGLDMLTQTKHFHLGYNQLSGDIPSRLFSSNMTIIHLILKDNKLTGSIPSTLKLVKSLQVMVLSNNTLTGGIPDLTGLNSLTYMELSNNSFDQSEFPPSFSTLTSLKTLGMRDTNIKGEIPSALFSIPTLQILDLSHNELDGALDMGSNPSKQLQLVDLQSNQITDFNHRPERSIDIRLVDNQICKESDVNEKFCMLPKTDTTESYSTPLNNCVPISCGFDKVLSPNCACACPYKGYLTFPGILSVYSRENQSVYNGIHDSLISLFTKYQLPVDSVAIKQPPMNLYDNLVINIEVFPYGKPIFNMSEILDLRFVLLTKGSEFLDHYIFTDDYHKVLPVSGSTRGQHKKWSSTGVIIGIGVAGCILVALLVLAGMLATRWKGQSEKEMQESGPFALWDPTSGSGGVPQLQGPRSFTFEELKKYTNNFSESNKIGAGGYGMVYKGTLPDGQLIAIKRAQQASVQRRVQFKTEIELLSRVHHKNVVGIIGFCFDQDEHMLVYEYIVNGTLKDSLLGRSGIKLDWKRRLKIALGAARGLQYLHELANPPIIHRDVKTNNILLDAQLVAKVADFGLSKPLNDADGTHVTTQVKGTMGYVDPEYYMTQQLSEKSDVYSFGVVMLEMITARNPVEKGKYIVREVIQTMDKNKELYGLHEVLDPTIGLSSELEGLERFVDLSLRCVAETGDQRPYMSEVVKELEGIMQLLGLNHDTESSSSASISYEGINIDYSHPYSNDSLFAYSGGFLPQKLQQPK